MDLIPPFTITPVLREAAEHRIEELDRTKQSFKRRYHLNTRRASEKDVLKRVSSLLEDIKQNDPDVEEDDDELVLDTITRYIEQARDTKSVSETKLLNFERQLWNRLDKRLRRMDVSSLHLDLMREVMDANVSVASAATKLEDATIDDDFELVEDGLDDLLENFEARSFTSKDVDTDAIEAYLSALFENSRYNRHLQWMRRAMKRFGEGLLADGLELDQDSLMWTIMDLLKNDLISPDRKRTLENYLQSPIALRELVATINMKSFRHWCYKYTQGGLSINVRQDSMGQHCITFEEEIIDMLFLQCTATAWASKFKTSLSRFVRRSGAFFAPPLTRDERDKREYYLGRPILMEPPPPPEPAPCGVCHPCFVPAPMPPPPPPPPRPPLDVTMTYDASTMVSTPVTGPYATVDSIKREDYTKKFLLSRLPTHDDGCTPSIVCPKDIQSDLLLTMAIDTKLRKALDGDASILSAEFDSLSSSLPHKTIIAVLKFFGVPQLFLNFFTRFLLVRLNLGPGPEGTPDRIVKRAHGASASHMMEVFLSEAVLVALDLAVHQKTNSYLYRLHDKMHFVGSQKQRQSAEEVITQFASIMGLELRPESSASPKTLRIGLLAMHTDTAVFEIDEAKLISHAHWIKKQLNACTTILDWVRIWNREVGTYAAHLFGPLADAFGKPHLDAVKSAHNRIYDVVLGGRDLTTYVKGLLQTHFPHVENNTSLAIEAIIYLPQAYGGLGVQDPFVTLGFAQDIAEDSNTMIEAYKKEEDAHYTTFAESFTKLTEEQRQAHLSAVLSNDLSRMPAVFGPSFDPAVFFPKSELTAHRATLLYHAVPEVSSYKYEPLPDFLHLCNELVREPVTHIAEGAKVSEYVSRLSGHGDKKPWRKLSNVDRWVLQMYSDECFEKYGTLDVWWAEGVPTEVYKALRGHVWDDGEDDDSTVSDVLETLEDQDFLV